MKYAIVIPDGCADEPQDELGGKTPLEAADTPTMDEMARCGAVGQSNNTPAHLPPGSDVATLSLLGYDPNRYYTGRAPLEAAAQGLALGPADWAVRCNLVTVKDQVMQDFTAGHITSDEARLLLDDLQREVGTGYLEFVPGVSYRNLLLLRGQRHPPPFTGETRTIPPHDLTGKSVCDAYPRGPGSDLLADLMDQSVEVFAEHPVNRQRALSGKPPATGIWLWGLGQSPQLDSFVSRYQVQGTMITAVDLLRGVARLIGWDCLDVPGATGYADTDYDAKGRAAVGALATCDLVCVHIEAPDEASHEGDTRVKVESLERIDSKVVRPLLHALRELGDFRLLVSPDHPTLLRTKTHSHGAVPWVMCGTGIHADAATTYDEASARDSRLRFDRGHELMGFFLGRTGNRQD